MNYSKIILLVITILLSNSVFAQQSNNAFGGVTVTIKCDSAMATKVYPNYEACPCKEWGVDYYNRSNEKTWGQDLNKSRDKLEKIVEAKANNKFLNPESDERVYFKHSEIYCNDHDLCPQANHSLIDNLLGKITGMKNMLAKLQGLYDQVQDNYGVFDRMHTEDGLKGYLDFVNNAVDEANKLYDRVMQYQKTPTSEIENELNNMFAHIDYYDEQATTRISTLQDFLNKQKVPCSNGNCPPGYTCVDGFCDKINAQKQDGNKIPCNGGSCPPGYTCKDGILTKNDLQNNPSQLTVPCNNGTCPPGYGCHLGNCEKGYVVPMGYIEGRVLTVDNQPVKNESVSIVSNDHRYTATTDDNGFYKIQVAAEGNYNISAGDKTASTNCPAKDGTVNVLEIKLDKSILETPKYVFFYCVSTGWIYEDETISSAYFKERDPMKYHPRASGLFVKSYYSNIIEIPDGNIDSKKSFIKKYLINVLLRNNIVKREDINDLTFSDHYSGIWGSALSFGVVYSNDTSFYSSREDAEKGLQIWIQNEKKIDADMNNIKGHGYTAQTYEIN